LMSQNHWLILCLKEMLIFSKLKTIPPESQFNFATASTLTIALNLTSSWTNNLPQLSQPTTTPQLPSATAPTELLPTVVHPAWAKADGMDTCPPVQTDNKKIASQFAARLWP
jgi:hypothetical protein